jgi:nitrite reductase/ring-hydroxylating ferredoxin subunit
MEFPKLYNFIEVASLDELPSGKCSPFIVADKPLALYNVDGVIYATDDVCPHAGGSLGMGVLSGTIITCPWHGMKFDVTNGCFAGTPHAGVATYPVKVDEEKIMVSILR